MTSSRPLERHATFRRALLFAGGMVAGACVATGIVLAFRGADQQLEEPLNIGPRVEKALGLRGELLMESGNLSREGKYDEAKMVAGSLYSLEPSLGLAAYEFACICSGTLNEFTNALAPDYLQTLRYQVSGGLLALCRAYERAGEVDKGLAFLERQKPTLAPDMYAYHVAYLLGVKGDREKALQMIEPLRSDPLWEGFLPPTSLREQRAAQ